MNGIRTIETMRGFVMLAVLVSCLYLFSTRFEIAFNGAPMPCLHANVFLWDKSNKEIRPGDLVVFEMNKNNDRFEKGLGWVKYAAAGPNSKIKIERNKVTINDQTVIYLSMDKVLSALEKNAGEFERTITTANDEWFVMGQTLESYDSRFWGPIKEKDIKGKAYAIY